ncbi:MAG: YggT family protein [Myxococcota bacterium]|nr:YggT family protein [Myxococcota bacterium]
MESFELAPLNISMMIEVYSYIVLAAVLITWFPLSQENPLVQALETFTEPVLKPIRKMMPDIGGIDFSPIVLLLLLSFLADFTRSL